VQSLDKFLRARRTGHDPSDAVVLSRLRVLLSGYFMLNGFMYGNWVVRIPDVKASVHASPGLLGAALLGTSGGAVLTMMISGKLCERYGYRIVTVASSAALAVSIALPGHAHSVLVLGVMLFLLGVFYGSNDVAINAGAVELVEHSGRPIMSGFHAWYSGGGLLGSLVGGLAAAHWSTARHLDGVAVVGVLVTLVTTPLLLRTPDPTTHAARAAGTLPAAERDRATRRRVWWLVVMFGTVATCTAYGEGAMGDWGALHLRDDLHTSHGMAAIGFASYSVAMVAGRLSGTWLIGRIGRTAMLVGGALSAAVGGLAAALTPWLPVAVVGFVLIGLGLANMFPVAMNEAGALNGPSGIALASTIGYTGMVMGPPLIGLIADHTGLPVAMCTIPVLAGAAGVIAVAAARAERRLELTPVMPAGDPRAVANEMPAG
jgi:MFS family permease